MTTKFRHKYAKIAHIFENPTINAKIAHILVLYRYGDIFCMHAL